jgi:hypothetical protein
MLNLKTAVDRAIAFASKLSEKNFIVYPRSVIGAIKGREASSA